MPPLPSDGMAAETTVDAFLGGALQIEQPARGYRAGIDAVLLAASVDVGKDDAGRKRCLDLGAGVGVVGLALATRCPSTDVTLLEREPPLAEMAGRNIARNGLAGRVDVVEGDVAGAGDCGLPEAAFDHVLANPPYYDVGAHRASPRDLKAASHGMPTDGLDAWLRFAARMARAGGHLTLIHRTESLIDVLRACTGRFGGIRVVPLCPRRGMPASRVIVQGRKGSRAPLQLGPELVLHGDDHRFEPAIDQVLRSPKALDFQGAT